MPIALLSERYNARQQPLILGLLILTGSQILLMEAPNYPVMCVARVLQGVGSSMVWVVGLALLYAPIFHCEREKTKCRTDATPRLHRPLHVTFFYFSVNLPTQALILFSAHRVCHGWSFSRVRCSFGKVQFPSLK